MAKTVRPNVQLKAVETFQRNAMVPSDYVADGQQKFNTRLTADIL